MRKTWGMILALLIAAGLVLCGCSRDDGEKSDQAADIAVKPIVAVTIVPQRAFVQAVCGDLAEVITLVPPGSSPENYEPTPQDRERFSQASLYFSIGVPMEEATSMPDTSGMKVIPLHKEAGAKYPDRLFEAGDRDPHIWLSPKRAVVMVEAIAREMSILDPQNKDTYEQNAKAYITKLMALDQEISSILKDVPVKKFIVFHPAFGYFADEYGLTMYALEEEGKEATPKHLQDMIDLAKQENIKAIFYQGEIDGRQSQAFAEEIGGKTIRLDPLAEDYLENLKRMAELIAEAAK